MRIAVISDIHGNLEAFQQVLADIKQCDIDTTICLGDNIGYGPDPESVVKLVQQSAITSVVGNHEQAVLDRLRMNWFNPIARQSLQKTLQMLSPASIGCMRTWNYSLRRHGCRFVHGFPPDSPTVYQFQVELDEMLEAFENTSERLCFTGHTHILELASFDGAKVSRAPMERGVIRLPDTHRFIINIGSVGQPRDGDNHAKYVIWDSTAETLEVRYVAYDIAAVARKIIELGLPRAHAARLW